MREASQLYFSLVTLLFAAGPIWIAASFGLILVASIWAYMRASPLGRSEYIFTIFIPTIWVSVTYIAVVAGLGGILWSLASGSTLRMQSDLFCDSDIFGFLVYLVVGDFIF
jgi:hypothetical protein